MNYECLKCKNTYPVESSRWKCDCGGLLSLNYNKKRIDFAQLQKSQVHTLWRYIDALPFEEGDNCWKQVSMGEGGTPLFPLSNSNKNLYAKAEYYSPTLSFKDRGAVMLISIAEKLGIKNVVVDSSGNAGTAIAAFGARVGINCNVFVPESTSDKKVAQICAHGATIHKVPGNREASNKAAINMVQSGKYFYASHIYNPFFYEGTKTYFYEVFEQMGLKLPDAFIIPVGNGTLALGAYSAFSDLMEWGYIEKMPKILVAQANNCSPIVQAFQNGFDEVGICENKGTFAEGIAIASPARGTQVLDAIKATGGDVIGVDEDSIVNARNMMARNGIYVEITSAVNYAAYELYLKNHPEFARQTVVIPLCCAGIKSN